MYKIRKPISIHSLYAEGDGKRQCVRGKNPISIHSLYVEGDAYLFLYRCRKYISIHSLYAEGDDDFAQFRRDKINFNPLPLRRGRPEGT